MTSKKLMASYKQMHHAMYKVQCFVWRSGFFRDGKDDQKAKLREINKHLHQAMQLLDELYEKPIGEAVCAELRRSR